MLRARRRKNVANCLMSETFIIDSTDVHFLKKKRSAFLEYKNISIYRFKR